MAKSKAAKLRALQARVERSRKASRGVTVNAIPDYRVEKKGVAPLSNRIPGGATPTRDLMTEHLWQGRKEKQAEIDKARARNASARVIYNKGPVMIPTSFDDPKAGNGRR